MEIPAAFRHGFFTEEISRVFGYSRVFLSLTQALDVDIFLTSVLLCLSCSRVEIMGLYKIQDVEFEWESSLLNPPNVSSSFEDVVAWRFRQRFVVDSSPKRFLGFFSYSRVFLSLAQALDVEIFLTSVLLCLSLAQGSKSWVYIGFRMQSLSGREPLLG